MFAKIADELRLQAVASGSLGVTMSKRGETRQLDKVRDKFETESQVWDDIYQKHKPWRGADQNFFSRLACVQSLTQGFAGELLDVGCGTGVVTLALCREGITSVTGIDIAAAMIERAKTNAALAGVQIPVDFRVAQVEATDLPDESFDVIVAVGVLEYVDDPEHFLAELARLARQGAAIVITVPNKLSPLKFWDEKVLNLIRPAVRLMKHHLWGTSPPVRHSIRHTAYSYRSLVNLAAKVNLRVDAHQYCTFCSASVERILPLGGPFSRLMDHVADRPWISWPAMNLVARLRK